MRGYPRYIFLLFLLCMLAAPSPARALYRIYLRSGSVLSGVSSYEEVNGEIRFIFRGGLVGVPEQAIDRIEEYEGEVRKETGESSPAQPAVGQTPGATERPAARRSGESAFEFRRIQEIKTRLTEIDRRLTEIGIIEERAEIAEKEYDRVRLRIENLFNIGRNKARQAGKTDAEYLDFLSQEERELVRVNFIKKRQMEPEVKRLKESVEPLASEKESLTEEKGRLEDELRSLGG